MLCKLSSGQRRPSKKHFFGHVTSVIGRNVTAAYRNSPGLLHTPAKFERNLPNDHRVRGKRKHGAHGAGGARYPPIYKQASLVERLMKETIFPSSHLPYYSHTKCPPPPPPPQKKNKNKTIKNTLNTINKQNNPSQSGFQTSHLSVIHNRNKFAFQWVRILTPTPLCHPQYKQVCISMGRILTLTPLSHPQHK